MNAGNLGFPPAARRHAYHCKVDCNYTGAIEVFSVSCPACWFSVAVPRPTEWTNLVAYCGVCDARIYLTALVGAHGHTWEVAVEWECAPSGVKVAREWYSWIVLSL